MRATKKWMFLFLAVLFLIPLGAARADAAPPMNPPGGDVSPEGDTQVQMVAEQVTIDFRQSSDDSAAVMAWFQFRNTGDSAEHLKVRFPLNGDPMYKNQEETYPLIDDFTAWIGGQKLATQVIKDDDPNSSQFFLGYGAIIYWSEFDMDFPIGTDVKLTVKYTLRPTVETSYAYPNYILATGAGWKGPIGKVDIIFRFPYILNEYNLPDFNYYNTPDLQSARTVLVQENEVRMHWEDLEPTDRDNVGIGIVQPHLWQTILQCRLQVISLPDDASAWLNLARAYAAAGQEHHGMFANENLAFLYIHAMERALTLNPKNASLHAEFAQNMADANLGGWNDYYNAIVQNELSTALQLDPNNTDIQAMADRLKQYYSLTLTTPGPFPTYAPSTPTLEATEPEPTSTLAPTPTHRPPSTPVPTLTSVPQTPTPIQNTTNSTLTSTLWSVVLGLALLISGFGVGVFVSRRKK